MRYFTLTIGLFLFGCMHRETTLFTAVPPTQSGVHFINPNIDRDSLSILDYLYFYNGAGVAIGDINNDGLPDLFFVSNTQGNRLYLNKGNWQFEDITDRAGVRGLNDWSTGVTMADVNGDGLLDIYVCAVDHFDPHDHNGSPHPFFQHSRNRLFLNNGNNTFTECAEKYGLDIPGYNTQAVFFDYDKDGDLDLFLLQHSTHQTDAYGPTSLREKFSAESGGKLYRNDGGHFTDVTKGSGIYSSALGYGLGVGVADLNQDGYDDIYVSNDFHENDYYYLNQGNGTFREVNNQAFGHESKFSMGNDIADINNDGWPDILTVDMLPEDEKVLKSSLGDDPLDLYLYERGFGYNYQYSRNCLQLNTGKGKKFSDIALYSGVAATDWSWSPLIADFNLDGRNDIFISNGIRNRPNDLDYVKFISSLPQPNSGTGRRTHDAEILKHLPPGDWTPYIFEAGPDLRFTDRSFDWGFRDKGCAQGSAYGDLDGDGAPDLVTNNMNREAGLYRNNTRSVYPGRHYLSLHLKGKAPNTFAIGAKTFLYTDSGLQYRELQPERGFLSSSEPCLFFGLGDHSIIDSLLIIWPDNTIQRLGKTAADQRLTLTYNRRFNDTITDMPAFIDRLLQKPQHPPAIRIEDITTASGLDYRHREDSFIDFSRQWYLPHELSTAGPKVAVADVDGDGLDDFFVGGAKGQGGRLFLQQADGRFRPSGDSAVFLLDRASEDVDAVFFDANGDHKPDLYVASGGNEYLDNAPELKDRLYLNDGKGHFSRSPDFPALFGNKSVVRVADMDHDGDSDIFVGVRADPALYGRPPSSFLLKGDGHGHFTDVTATVAPGLTDIGMVTDAIWSDVDGDGWTDLIVVGEWMPPVLFRNRHGKLVREALTDDDVDLAGWWCSVQIADINGDGRPDLLLGNYGLNSKLTATPDYPLKMYVGDFMGNGRMSQVLAVAKKGQYYTFLNKENLEARLPFLKRRFLSYDAMAGKTISDVFGSRLDSCARFMAYTLASMALINDGKGHFKPTLLPVSAQWAPLFAFTTGDFDGDGHADLLTGGDFFGTQPYEGRYDAMPLTLYHGDGKGGFTPVLPLPPPLDTLSGEVRSLRPIRLAGGGQAIIVGFNNDRLRLLRLRPF